MGCLLFGYCKEYEAYIYINGDLIKCDDVNFFRNTNSTIDCTIGNTIIHDVPFTFKEVNTYQANFYLLHPLSIILITFCIIISLIIEYRKVSEKWNFFSLTITFKKSSVKVVLRDISISKNER